MNLKTLRYFVAIADAGSFTAAATAVSIAQPALTRQLHDLEADLGVQLLQRHSRGVRLTQAGATLYESARRMLAEAARVRARLDGSADADDVESTVVLGVSPTLTRVLLPGVFERCHSGLVGVKLVVREAFTPQLLEGLERGQLDIAVVTNPEPDPSLSLQLLLAEPFALITPADRGMPDVVTLPMLARVPLLMTRLHRSIVEPMMVPLGARLNIQAEIDSVDAISELVLQGRWATIMPVSVFKRLRGGVVTISEISGVQAHRMLVVAARAERAQAREITVVADVLRAEAARRTSEGMFSFGDSQAGRRLRKPPVTHRTK
jgi:LysR family nitrogen assimilation transcriptional regulator